MKDNPILRFWVYALTFVLLSGCSYLIEITRTTGGNQRPSFHLNQDMPLFFDRAPKVTEVAVYAKSGDKWNYQAPVWHIESMEGVTLRRIEYGVVPSGFVIKTNSAELTPMHDYKIDVRAWGAVGELVFTLNKGSI